MAVIKAFAGALGGTFADLWRDIITAGPFTEHTVVVPGIPRRSNNDRGSNEYGSERIITNGSRIYVPENTAAFIFSETGIENVITESGGYEYRNGEQSVLAGDGIGSFFNQVADRFTFGGQPGRTKYVAFVNLREIRGIKFGTSAPLVYNDRFYGVDLEIRARGSMSLKVTDPVRFVRNFVPATTVSYSFDDEGPRRQILSEFVQSFIVAINLLSNEYRISQLPGIGSIATHACCDVIRLAGQLRNTIFIGQQIDGHNKRLYEFGQNLPTWPSICCPMNIVFRNCPARRMT